MSMKNAVAIKRRDDYRKFKAVVSKRQRDFVETGTALGLIRKDALYKEGGFASFEEFVEAEFDMPRSTAYRLVDAARVVTILSQVGTIESKITNQSQALQLAPLGRDRDAMIAVIETAEARGTKITATALEAARTELYPHIKVIDGELVGDRPALEAVAEPLDDQTAAEASSRPADGGTEHPAAPPATGPGAQTHQGEADRPGPVVNPTDLTDEGDGRVETAADPSAPSGDRGVKPDGAPTGDEQPPAPPADERPQAPHPAAAPGLPSSPVRVAEDDGTAELVPGSSDADPVQDGDEGPRPAPAPSDPAALLEWFADEVWAHVDADVSGPLLTTDDMQMLADSLTRIAEGVDLLMTWAERAQP